MSFVLPVVLGHRGARAVKTENTIEAFRYACQSGVKWVELDAMLSADKTVMVFHDETLDRMAGVDGRLDEFTAERLRALTLKTGAKIPTLAEVLDVLNEFQACVNIEIKPSRPELARETARQVWQVIREKGFDDPDRLFFSSFAWDALEETLVFAPHIRRGVLVEDISGDWRPAAKKVSAYSINYDADLLTPELIKEIKDGGYHLLAYTVNDPALAKQLRAQGTEAFFCDDPVNMMTALA
ncbi:MAG: hypothetical protein J6L82_01010 [Alphaproteobacteria bacterium]|nr:hypothetical protein [Alphaproteobacteria bacterium]